MSGEHEHGHEGCCGGQGGHDDGHECGCQGEKKQKPAAMPAKTPDEKGCGCGGHGHDHADGHHHHHGEGGCCGGH